ncbi:PREDICTED: serine protease gd-like [Vollenhovia emeryi]|uniref:serine protease gd-like n=1 Tax=Vollenhovia emeryi TaxID=411798 RepID=UPI0005F504FC|nr:PREDICTED: serine protease gd-like [Vollenhovia emeryi]
MSYNIHPECTSESNADSDIAILILKQPIEFSPIIKPICLWSGSFSLDDVVNRTRYIVGWGEDALGRFYVHEQRMTRETCLRNNRSFDDITSPRTFCAGSLEVSPCHGDSESGPVLLDSFWTVTRVVINCAAFFP